MKPVRVVLLMLFPAVLFAQTDSLKRELEKAKGGERKLILEILAKELENKDVGAATRYAREALAIAENIPDTAAMEQLCGMLGQLNRLKIAYDSSRMYYERALALSRKRHVRANEAEYLNGLGLLYRQQGHLQQAISISLQALQVAEQVHEQKQISDAYFNIGYVFNMLNNYDSALLYHNKSIALREALGDSVRIATSYNGIGLVQMKKDNYNEARKLYLKAVSLLDRQANPRQLAMIYNNIGITYENQSRFEEGRKYYFKSLEIKKEMNDFRGMASTYGNLADNYRESGKPNEAILYATLSAKLSRETKSLDYLITAHKILSYAYEQKGEFKKSLKEFRAYKGLQDSLYNENKTRQINELINRYSLEKKERENVMLKAAASVNEFKMTRQKLIILTTMITLGIVLLMLTFLYRLYMKSKSLVHTIALQKAETDASNRRLQEVLVENDNMTSIMVHDLRSPMNQVLGLAELMQKDGTLTEHQSVYINMMTQAVGMGRRIIDDLLAINNRESLTIEPFAASAFLTNFVEPYKSAAKKKDILLQVDIDHTDAVIVSDQEIVRRILDNLVSNAIKFSPREKKVIVQLRCHEGHISISVIDEGPGFSEEDKKRIYQKFMRLSARPTGGEPSTGLGLAIVKHLIDQLNGEITLESTPGAGATFTINLPAAAESIHS